MTGRIEAKPGSAEPPMRGAVDVRRGEPEGAPRTQQGEARREGGSRIVQMLDDMAERDRVERLGVVRRRLQRPPGYVQAEAAPGLDRHRVELEAGHLPACGVHRAQERRVA